jgi:adenylate cyclase class 2
MPREIEAKYCLADPAPYRARLEQIGATCGGRVMEQNQIFDSPDGKLRRAGSAIRLRTGQPLEGTARPAATLTYKGPREAGLFKAREEIETEVASPEAAAEIIERLGLRPVAVYEKRRETWRLELCDILLDELPLLGWWLEIEGPDDAAIEHVAARLGLADATLVHETYVHMALARGTADETGCRRLVFHP